MSNRPKSTYKKTLQDLARQYRRVHPDPEVVLSDVAMWAIRSKLWMPPIKNQVAELSRDLGDALRAEFIELPDGTRMRRNHAVRRTVKTDEGELKQMHFWGEADLAPVGFMHLSFSQRREALADKAYQLKQDVDGYNLLFNKAAPIQMSFDFTEDLEERRFSDDSDREE